MIVILHNIRSLHNVGSIFRTADAAGAEKVYLCGITPTPMDSFGSPREQLTKVSLGAEKTVPWEHKRSASSIIKKLKKEGYKVFAIEQDKKSVPYYKVKDQYFGLRKSWRTYEAGNMKIALILGSEVKGLPSSILKTADKILEIPMRGALVRQAHHPRLAGRGKESLNVAVAFGIVAFHLAYSKNKT